MTQMSHSKASAVVFVGPLPPPVHGFSAACAAMLEVLKNRGTVAVFDRSRRAQGPITAAIRQMSEAIRYVRIIRLCPGIALYLGVSGGFGQLIDGFYIAIAKVYRRRIFVHHHSYAYITKATIISKLLFSLLRDATHIVLSPGMGTSLAERYKFNRTELKVVSNAAFFGSVSGIARAQSDVTTPIRLGFLGNITFAKGFVEFFEVLAELRRLSVPYRAYIAGPISPEARETFNRLMAAADQVDYRGALYDDAKMRFYLQLDILLFPTRYVNEAEPLVIHEALRSGVYVLACARGAIPELLSNGAGLAVDQQVFVASAATYIRGVSLDRAVLALSRQSSFEQARRLQAKAEGQLSDVIDQILRGA